MGAQGSCLLSNSPRLGCEDAARLCVLFLRQETKTGRTIRTLGKEERSLTPESGSILLPAKEVPEQLTFVGWGDGSAAVCKVLAAQACRRECRSPGPTVKAGEADVNL